MNVVPVSVYLHFRPDGCTHSDQDYSRMEVPVAIRAAPLRKSMKHEYCYDARNDVNEILCWKEGGEGGVREFENHGLGSSYRLIGHVSWGTLIMTVRAGSLVRLVVANTTLDLLDFYLR